MIREEHIKNLSIILIIVFFTILSFLIVKPFLLTILTAMIFAYIFHPVYIGLKRTIRNANVSAALISIIIVTMLGLLLWFLLPLVIRQTFIVYSSIQRIDFVAPLRQIAPNFFASAEFTRDFTVTFNTIISKGVNSIMGQFEAVLSNLATIFVHLIVLIFLFFFALRDGDKIVRFLKELSPFKEETEKRFIAKFSDITKSVIYGMFIIGIVQGITSGIGFYLFKAPQPLLLTLLGVIFGILPVVGTWTIWIPLSLFMFISGNASAATGMILYNLLMAAWIDFGLRPYIIKRMAGISPITALIGMLGGGYLFGIMGFVIGPLVLGYLILFLDFYRNKTLNELFG